MLYQTPALDDADRRVLAEIDQHRQQLRHQLIEPRRWDRPLRRSLTARAIVGSNTIEGYVVSIDDAEALVSGEEMSAEPDEAARAAVQGYHDALTYGQHAAGFEVFAYEEMLLSALHFMMLKHSPEKWPGRYRTGGIWITGGPGRRPVYTGPDPDRVPGLMRELIDWLRGGDLDAPAFVRASMAHLNLVGIHPWRDGNGRMSRCLHTLLLARDRVLAPEFSSIEEWLGMSMQHTSQYYAALNRTNGGEYRPERDAYGWVRFCLQAHHLQAQLVAQRVTITARIWDAASQLAESRNLHERMVTALYSAAGGHLRRATYENDEGLSRDQAIRDLSLLVQLGLISPAGRGNQRHYTAGTDLRDRTEAIRREIESVPFTEPYSLKQEA
ncbi:MAG: Fic family protein [Egibacteraceae bacterium]